MVSLLPYNTLRVPAQANSLLEINTPDNLSHLDIHKPFMFLGQGANVLFTQDFPGTIAKINLTGFKVIQETDTEVLIEAGAGQNWHQLVSRTVENNWSGMENMALIPGTVGAAVVGNIAAYGGNQEDIFESLIAYNLISHKSDQFSKFDCRFGYRESAFKHEFKNQYLITAVRFRLSKILKLEVSYHATRHASLLPTLRKIAKKPYTLRNVYDAIIKMRTAKLPNIAEVGTAGSFFKNPIITKEKFSELSAKIPDLLAYPVDKLLYTNPSEKDKFVKLSVARVLDELGWKGKTIGHVSTSPNQALYVINLGGATGQEIYNYSEAMRADVKKNFDIDLEYEVQVI